MGAAPAEARPQQLEEVYRRCKEPLFELVQACFPTLRGCEHDLYQTAWASLLDGRPIDDIEQYLEVAVYRAGLKELRRRQRRPIVPLSVAQFRNGSGGKGVWQQGVEAVADRTDPLPEEQVESREDARMIAEVLDELTALQRKIVKLRWGCGIPRREVAALLDISERSVKREMLAATRVIARNAELERTGRWCEQKRGLVVAYSLGTLSHVRAARAREHLRRCVSCREVALAVRDRMQGIASVLPLPGLVASPSSQGILTRAAEFGDSFRSGLTDLAAGAKDHALAIFARTPAADTAASQVAVGGGLRGGGSALAAVTACLVAGGGATYCAIDGVPDSLRNLASIEQVKHREPRPDRNQPRQENPPAIEQPAPTASVPPAESSPQRAESAEPKLDSSSAGTAGVGPSPAPQGSVEFGPESTPAKSSVPAAASSSGGGEFMP